MLELRVLCLACGYELEAWGRWDLVVPLADEAIARHGWECARRRCHAQDAEGGACG